MKKIFGWIAFILSGFIAGFYLYPLIAVFQGPRVHTFLFSTLPWAGSPGMLTRGGAISFSLIVGSLIWGGLTLQRGKVGKAWIGLLGIGLVLVVWTISMMW